MQMNIGFISLMVVVATVSLYGYFTKSIKAKSTVIYCLITMFFLVAFFAYGPTYRGAASSANERGVWNEQFSAGMTHLISSIVPIRIFEVLLVGGVATVLLSFTKR